MLLPVVLLVLILFLDNPGVNAADKNATVFGTPPVKLSVGASVEDPLERTLTEVDQVTVKKLQARWYRVNTANGQGYDQKSLLKLAADTSPQQLEPQPSGPKPTAVEPNEPAKEEPLAPAAKQKTRAPAKPMNQPRKEAPQAQPTMPVASAALPKSPETKSPSILQMIEGSETELTIALAIAGIAFALGWLCGGSYYLRRERKSLRKLRL